MNPQMTLMFPPMNLMNSLMTLMYPPMKLMNSLMTLMRWRSRGAPALLTWLSIVVSPAAAVAQSAPPSHSDAVPLVVGETFTIESVTLGEIRTINVYLPPPYAADSAVRLPVLYMPDGGIGEDFLHVAGLVQVSVGNGTMRPFILVGIENTARRRDLTGPTTVEDDRKIAPVVGGSTAFREFIRTELMPSIRSRYRTTDESAIVGESLAGLFIVETLLLEPEMFDTYIAFDPSLWWNGGALVRRATGMLDRLSGKRVYLAASRDDVDRLTQRLAEVMTAGAPGDATWHYQPMPEERHATIYHPAALKAFRWAFQPAEE